jgi:outer membrane receptor protein involved in Fe transport
VEVTLQGFKKFIQSGVMLEVNRNARVDPVLEVGTISESVQIANDAPLIETTNPTLGQTVTEQEVANIPLVDRDLYDLLSMTSGVDSSQATNDFGYPGRVTIINGSSYGGAAGVNYNLDGSINTAGLRNTGNSVPNPDAVREFRVMTNNYSAEYGRFAGGVVDVLTKSGSNSLHGSLFEYLRNNAMAALPWTPGGAVESSPLHRNQFGGSLGGPVIHDKTFFFVSYQGLRQRQQDLADTAIVPTALERAGNFSASKSKPRDPLTNAAFPGNIIPASRLDKVSQNLLNQYIPLPNQPNNFYLAQTPRPTDTDEFLIKMDQSLQKHQIAGSYFFQNGSTSNNFNSSGTLPWTVRSFDWRQQNAGVSDTWSIGPWAVNQLRVAFVRSMGGRDNSPKLTLHDLGSNMIVQGDPTLSDITVSGYFRLGTAIAGSAAGSNIYQVRDVLAWAHGRHALKFGGELSTERTKHFSTLNNYGVYSFSATGTGSQAPRSGNALGDFVLGLPNSLKQDAPVDKTDNGWYTGLFVQDDIRLKPRLTINLGLRYDLQLPYTDPQNRKLTWVAGARSQVVPKALPGLLFPGDPGVANGIVAGDKKNFGPRVGLAWDPFGDGRTSVRAGAGIFYGSLSGNEWNTTADGQPFSMRQTFTNVKSFTDPYGNLPQTPFPYLYSAVDPVFLLPAGVNGVSLDFRLPYTYQTNLSVQRQVLHSFAVTAAYVGSLTHHLPYFQDVNYPLYQKGATTANVDDRRPYSPGKLSDIQLVKSILNSAYHGMQLTVEKRMANHFSFKANYTFSKSLSGAEMQRNTSIGFAQDENNLSLERGPSALGHTHVFVFSGIWRMNYFNNMNRWIRAVANGWSVSTITTMRSGDFFTVTSGRDNNVDGNASNDRPMLVGDPVLVSSRPRGQLVSQWFNPAAFVQNPAGTDGNAGRNILTGPRLINIDLGLFREFQIGERVKLELRGEIRNAPNMVNLGVPVTSLSSAAVAQIRDAKGMRVAQAGARLLF